MSDSFLSVATPFRIFMWLIFLIAFLLGSIPFGLIIARMFKVNDLYKKGSGNIGASNVSRVVGFWPAGFATFILDVAKGVAAVWLATPVGCHLMTLVLGGSIELHSCQFDTIVIWSAGLFAILGHCYSPWLHFKGGKGVATSLGVILILSPISALFGILAFALTFIFKRVASLASIAGLGVATVTYLVFNPTGIHLCVGSAMILLILIRHEANIDALLENREKSFS